MMNHDSELEDLNSKTFTAEEGGATRIGDQSWKEFLEDVLADDFRIVRSKVGAQHQKQNKEDMIKWIADNAREGVHANVQDARSWKDAATGGVTCYITLNGKDYQNIKVFKKSPEGRWQCIYWQVTQLTPDPPSSTG